MKSKILLLEIIGWEPYPALPFDKKLLRYNPSLKGKQQLSGDIFIAVSLFNFFLSKDTVQIFIKLVVTVNLRVHMLKDLELAYLLGTYSN